METPKVHGVPSPKGLSWLNEVRVDAAQAAVQHLKDQKAREDFKAAKARGITPGDILEQGKRDLGLLEEAPNPPVDESTSEDKPLARMNKEELLAVAKVEDVEVNDDMTRQQVLAAINVKLKGGK